MASYIYSYEKLRDRLEQLPLILAGPILRRVTPTTVTVWLALRKPSKVVLTVQQAGSDKDLLSSDARDAKKIGENLYLLAITARTSVEANKLRPATLYTYRLTFNGKSLDETGVYGTNAADLHYPGFSHPSFVLAPSKWEDLHLLHGSCRKFHAIGDDALPWGDDALKAVASKADQRHQMLLLTGDQIYADDVAAPSLHIAQDVGETLLGPSYEEKFLDHKLKDDWELLRPGRRSAAAELSCHFTAGDGVDSSHLFFFSEFCATYLMAWSDVPWPTHPSHYPNYKQVFFKDSDGDHALQYVNYVAPISGFVLQLKRVRRLLANIATYMILDDHEITDDAFISANWSARVLGSLEGRQVVRNAFKAYSVFQAWGNTPDQFDVAGSPGDKLLGQLFKGPAADDETVDYLLGIPHKNEIFSPNIYPNAVPAPDTPTGFGADIIPNLSKEVLAERNAGHAVTFAHKPPGADGKLPFLVWFFTLHFDTYQLLFLDPRMWRWYPGSPVGDGPHADYPCIVLSPEGMTKQVLEAGAPPKGTDPQVTFLITAGPPLSVPAFEELQGFWSVDRGRRLVNFFDTESWSAHEHGLQWFLSTLATRDIGKPDEAGKPRQRRVIVLSGDVHHSFAVRIRYWARKPYNTTHDKDTEAVFALLTSSAFKNEDWKTSGATTLLSNFNTTRKINIYGLHGIGNRPFKGSYGFVCWANLAKERMVIGSRQEAVRGAPVTVDWVTEKTRPAVVPVADVLYPPVLQKPSDWRYRVDYIRAKHSGRSVVGHNNLCEVHFRVEGGATDVVQHVWWHDQLRTTFNVNLDLTAQPAYPDPEAGIYKPTP